MRRLTGLSLWRSKILTTQVPAVILDGIPQEDATAAVAALHTAGAEAETRPNNPETAPATRQAPHQRRTRR
ncbi:hypothetical protein GCM10011578_060340 [Streptomyces fuscichromogenes]|uniref:Large ribosomal subunit protein bL12 C-terminal domain-containing protein n=1 Tax=Streptomyces fuscichromogenes TaxID=1324013 RepID=A0A917XHI5_9ACTN|nr:hypothetical protein GCM10011578_060340 [Streptomyces fuscichromogenes]